MREARWDAGLWIGTPEWPGPEFKPRPWDGLGRVEFQIAGILCHHQKFFGLEFRVPSNDPLALLADRYYESHLPGTGNPEYATPLESILVLRDELAMIHLALDPVHYAKFAEAYLPIEPESAWRYAMRRGLRLLAQPPHPEHDIHLDWSELGIEPTWDAAQAYLQSYWEYYQLECFGRIRSEPVWAAVASYNNCD